MLEAEVLEMICSWMMTRLCYDHGSGGLGRGREKKSLFKFEVKELRNRSIYYILHRVVEVTKNDEGETVENKTERKKGKYPKIVKLANGRAQIPAQFCLVSSSRHY